MMTRFLISTLVALMGFSIASAQDGLRGDDVDEDAPLTSRPGSIVVMRGLDKVTAETRDFEIRIGEAYEYGPLTITPTYCRKRPPEETPEIFAFLQIVDRRTDGFGQEEEPEPIFSGWMFGSNPALNPLEHSVYDAWVIDCRA